MRFRIQFADGHVEGDTADPADLALINGIRDAIEAGHDHLTIGLEGGRIKTVGDIQSIEIKLHAS